VTKRRRQPLGQTIGGILFGFEQQVLRTAPPAQELVRHARPDDPVPAADGSLVTIRLPDDAQPEAAGSPDDAPREATGRPGDGSPVLPSDATQSPDTGADDPR
jgi:hypothetical protein